MSARPESDARDELASNTYVFDTTDEGAESEALQPRGDPLGSTTNQGTAKEKNAAVVLFVNNVVTGIIVTLLGLLAKDYWNTKQVVIQSATRLEANTHIYANAQELSALAAENKADHRAILAALEVIQAEQRRLAELSSRRYVP